MLVLIDYANVPSPTLRRGAAFVVEQAIQRAADGMPNAPSRAHARFYSGWYEQDALTREAQQITADLGRDFPRAVPIGGGRPPISVSAEIALSLLAAPAEHLLSTYRRKSAPHNLRSTAPVDLGCAHADCPLISVHHYVRQQTCPRSKCMTDVSGLLFRGEQKMVDTMLAADMMTWDRQIPDRSIVLVANDHDYWPPTRVALSEGATVTQVDTFPAKRLPERYERMGGPRFRWMAFG